MSMPETRLKIRIFGDPSLRKKAKPVSKVTERHRDVLSQMARLMYDASGIGLAAPQVAVAESMIVVDIGSGLYKLINPRVSDRKGSQGLEEGCLSIPGICIKIKRAKNVKVVAMDEYGKPVSIEAEGLLACALQHEIDHLKGKLIVDYASFLDRLKIKKKLQDLKEKSGAEETQSNICKLQL